MKNKVSLKNFRSTRSWEVSWEDQKLYEMNYIENFYSKKKKKNMSRNINFYLFLKLIVI